MTVHRCSICTTPTYETRQTIRYEGGTGPLILHGVPVHHCPRCGDHEITLSRAPQLKRELAMNIARKAEPLGPREVRFLREFLGMSRGELADTVGATEEQTALWENVDDPAAMPRQEERLLRVLVVTGKRPSHA